MRAGTLPAAAAPIDAVRDDFRSLVSSRTVHRPARSASRRLAQGVAFPALLALVCSLLLSAAAAAAETDPAPVEEPAPGPRVVDVSKPGSKSAVVRNLRRALQAADEGRRIPSDATPRYDRLTEGIRDLPGRCTASPGESRHRICARGDRDGAITVAVFGNSHVAMWLPGLEREASRLGVRIEPFIKYGCTPYRFQMYRDGRAWRECSQWREWALGRLGDRKPDLVVVGSHTWLVMGDEAGRPIEGGATWDRKWRSGVRRTAGYLSRRIDQVVILGDTTTRASRPAKCAQSRGATMRSCEHVALWSTCPQARTRCKSSDLGFVHGRSERDNSSTHSR